MFGIRFIKFQPNQHVIKYRRGKIVKEGPGLAFYYFVPTTSIVAIPMGSFDTPFIFEQLTADFQTVSIQGQLIYRIIDHKKIAQLLNFTLNKRGDAYLSDDPQKLSARIVNIARVLTKQYIETLQLKDTMNSTEALSQKLNADITKNSEIQSLGVEVLGLSILAVLPNKDTARALEAEAREQILKKADDAIYERRNSSIEQERRIKENELNTEIAIETKKKEIRETQMEAERAIQEKQNQMRSEQLTAKTLLEEKRKQLVKLAAENAKAEADSKAYGMAAVMKAMQSVDGQVLQALANLGMNPDKLIAIAFQQIAGKAEKIGQLNISPDLLKQLMAKDEE